ncbi:unnamed protein product [Acanthoscelides obtectus]|nr:unnamed protein product [Acanthoscelides obtectus]CAK1665530.1 Piezo-type mechanosensitive ion channel component [Acanthoscelides obtectus]
MTRYGLGVFILRVVVPIMISLSLVMRPSIMCLIYLGMLLYLPFINLIDERNLDTGAFKYIMTFVPYQTMATQLGFYLYTQSTNEILEDENASLRRLLKNVGLAPLNNLDALYSVCWFGPEVVMIMVSLLYTWAVRMMASKAASEDVTGDADQVWMEKFKYLKISASAGKFITIIFLLWSAMWHHCIFGVCYFLIFLFFMTVWAFNKSLITTLSTLLFFCMPISMTHTIGQYVLQIEQVQYQLSDRSTQLRILGIDQLANPKPDYGPDYTHYEYGHKDLVRLLYPVIVYVLYYFMVNEAMMLNSLNKFLTEQRKRGFRTQWSKRMLVMAANDSETDKPDTGNLQSLIGESTKHKIWRHSLNISRNIIALIVKYSYVGTICAYVMWSVTFLTWSSFVLLTLGIALWMVPDQRKATVYSCFGVIVFSYIDMTYLYIVGIGDGYLLSVWDDERTSIFHYGKITRFMTLEVCIKVMFTVMFWITIRKYTQDKEYVQQKKQLAEKAGMSETDSLTEKRETVLEKICLYFLVRYWIVAIALFIISWCVFMNVVRIFRIVNMFEYLLFMSILQLSFRLWRRLLLKFWSLLIAVTLMNMMFIYFCQIRGIEHWMEERFGIGKKFHAEYGALITSSRSYINRLFFPAIFVTMTLIQIRFFHATFMRITDSDNKQLPAEIEASKEQFGKFFRHVVDWTNMAFLFMEIHIIKAVTLMMFLMCILDPSALYFLIFMPLALSMIVPFQSIRLAVMYWAAILVSISTLFTLIYSLPYFDNTSYQVTCEVTKYPFLNKTTRSFGKWAGLEKHRNKNPDEQIITIIAWETAFVLVSCLRNVVIAVQKISRLQRGLSPDPPSVMFPEVTFREADINLKNYIKYVMNYGFYRMGYEISMTMIVIVIVLRMDGFAIMYSVWLCLLLILRRSVIRWIWIVFVTFVALSIIWQYVMAIGLPPTLCMEYEWETRSYYWTVAQDFWFLVDNYHPPPIRKLIPESILLMFASQQLMCFWTEIRTSRNKIDYDGGSNDSIIHHFEKPGFVIPVADFTTYTTSYLDLAKRIFINMSYWGCMWLVFLGSVNRANIFSIIYLCYVFIYLWHGLNIYYKPLPLILKYWNHLIVQNILIIVMKTGMQVIGCFYMTIIPMEYCGFIKLFGIGCVRNFEHSEYFDNLHKGIEICRVSKSEMAGVEWDAAIFFFLMIQRRVFCSYNFFHIVNDAKAQHVLSARGANILDELYATRIKKMKDDERKVRQAVETKLTKLVNNQKKLQGAYYKNNIVTHKMAIRSADYYMFDDNETDVEEQRSFKQRDEEDLTKRKRGRRNLISLFGDMVDSNMRTAVKKYWNTAPNRKGVTQRDEGGPYGFAERVIYFFKFIWAAMDVLIVSATEFLGRYTMTYDMVRDVLNKERRQLKEQTDYDVGVRVEGWWLPRASFEGLIKNSKLPRPRRPPKEMSSTDLPAIMKLMKALWVIIVARSDLLCYVCVIMNQIMQCQLITIPLSIMVYLWGMLSNPRPSKTFWIIMIGYVELVILLKCIFQFEMMPGNNRPNAKTEYGPLEIVNPFFPSKFMGLTTMNLYYIWEMFILMAIVIHRYYLTNIGLWSTVTTSILPHSLDGLYAMQGGELVKVAQNTPTGSTTDEYIVRSIKTSILDQILLSFKTIFFHYAISFRQFHQRLLMHVYQEASDYYTVMFFFDFCAFATITTLFPVFSEYEPKASVWTYVSTSVIPVRYVMVVFLHFICILIDRAIYLQRSLVLKLVYHFLHVAFVHIWMFVLIPNFINGRMAIEQPAIVAYYIFRCIYLLISAQQIRVGYPSRIWGFYCFHKCGIWNYVNIQGYLLIPFLFELRSSFDWMFTDTSMSIFDWFRMEDIYTSVFKVKCLRGIEDDLMGIPAVKKKLIYKCVYGISLLIFLIILIWFPVMVYSWGRVAGQSNRPSAATLKFQFGDAEPIYENKADLYA